MTRIIISASVILAAAALLFAVEEQKSPAASTTEHHVMNPADLKWGEAPPGLPPGGKMAVLNGDPTQSGPFTVRLKAPAGYKILPHTHPSIERVTVISGKSRIGMGEKFDDGAMHDLGPASYVILPTGMAHYVKMTTESIVQIDSEGPFQINYVNPMDDPRNKENKK